MLELLALLAQDWYLREPRTSPVAAYGAFRLEREDCIEHPEIGVLHYPHCFPKVRLIWSSADGRVSARYEDNGGLLTTKYEYSVRAEAPDVCFSGTPYSAYQARPAKAADWQSGTKAFAALLARCGAVQPAEVAGYRAEFAAAAPDYEHAAGGMRTLAIAMFRTLRRCTRLKFSPRRGGPDSTATCTRHEGPDS
jgi:hypothetical protein